ncbi:MAG: ATPase [Cellulosilyticum sp.]|nr:ATPase [Cellulosilyticum sp.]
MENARCGEISVLLDQLEDLIEDGKTNFLSGKVAIDKELMLDIIRDIRLKLPTEVQQSVWIIEERNKIIDEAQKEAYVIREEAREEMQMMIEKDQITQYAKERAEYILLTAKEDAKQMHMGAVEYAQDTCKDVEQRLKFTLESIHQEVQVFESYITDLLREVYDNRQELKEMSAQIEQQED